MKKDEALRKAMHALNRAAWDLIDPKDFEKNMENKTLKEIHAAIQTIRKALEDQKS
jgi:aminoglycoside phosphotransferase